MWRHFAGITKPPEPVPKPQAKPKGRPKSKLKPPSDDVPELPKPLKRSSTKHQMAELSAQVQKLQKRLEPEEEASEEAVREVQHTQLSEMAAKIAELQKKLQESEAQRSQGSASSSSGTVALAEKVERALSDPDLSTPEKQGELGAVVGELLGGASGGEAGKQLGSAGRDSGFLGGDHSGQQACREAGKKFGHLGAEAGKQFGYLGGRPKTLDPDVSRVKKAVQELKTVLQPSRKEEKAASVRIPSGLRRAISGYVFKSVYIYFPMKFLRFS